MHTSHRLFLSFVILLVLVGCNQPPSPTPNISPLQSPLTVATNMPVKAIPTPQVGKGVVKGILNVEKQNVPMVGADVFLGSHVGSTNDTPLFGLDPKSAPHAVTDQNGQFVFTDVAPGKYALIVWNPVNSFIVRTPGGREPLDIVVEAQKVVDVGVLSEPRPGQ